MNYRDFAPFLARLRPDADRASVMRQFVDIGWELFGAQGVSWIGFYLYEAGEELILNVCRDKPACSPIGLHGACGRSFREVRPMIVTDVAKLGANYVACDPRDRSELIIPLISSTGWCGGVLDLDSHSRAEFGQHDLEGFSQALVKVGLLQTPFAGADAIVI